MFLKSRKTVAAATLSVMLPLSSAAITSRISVNAPQAVEFSLRSTEGQTVTSDSLRGEVVVLAFGASWLPITRKQVQGIRKLADTYSAHGVIVYWVSTDSEKPNSRNYASDDQLRAFARKYDMNLTVLRDPDGKVSKQFGVDQVPAVVILDKQGEVHGEPINGIDPNGNLDDHLAPVVG